MLTNLLDACPLLRVYLKYSAEEANQGLTSVLRDFVLASLYHVIELCRVRVIEREEPETHSVQYDPRAPYINLGRVVDLSTQHLRRSITGTATCSLERLSFGVNIAESEVNNFDIELIIQQYVLRLQVAMHHPHLLQVLNSAQDLL